MSLKLNSSGGGSVTLQEPSTASNLTVTLPTTTGTAVIQNASNNLLMNSGYGSDAVAYGCRAWVNFNGTGTVAIRASGNVSSITDNGVGQYTLNFTSAMPDLNYATVGSAWYSGVTGILFSIESTPSSTTSKSINTNNPGATSNSDATYISVAIFR
jgi:hypothetical protein